MKHIETKYTNFIKLNESIENDQGYTLEDLYNMGAERIIDAANLLSEEGTAEHDEISSDDPDNVIDKLKEFGGEEAQFLINQIEDIQEQIANFPEDEDEDDW